MTQLIATLIFSLAFITSNEAYAILKDGGGNSPTQKKADQCNTELRTVIDSSRTTDESIKNGILITLFSDPKIRLANRPLFYSIFREETELHDIIGKEYRTMYAKKIWSALVKASKTRFSPSVWTGFGDFKSDSQELSLDNLDKWLESAELVEDFQILQSRYSDKADYYASLNKMGRILKELEDNPKKKVVILKILEDNYASLLADTQVYYNSKPKTKRVAVTGESRGFFRRIFSRNIQPTVVEDPALPAPGATIEKKAEPLAPNLDEVLKVTPRLDFTDVSQVLHFGFDLENVAQTTTTEISEDYKQQDHTEAQLELIAAIKSVLADEGESPSSISKKLQPHIYKLQKENASHVAQDQKNIALLSRLQTTFEAYKKYLTGHLDLADASIKETLIEKVEELSSFESTVTLQRSLIEKRLEFSNNCRKAVILFMKNISLKAVTAGHQETTAEVKKHLEGLLATFSPSNL